MTAQHSPSKQPYRPLRQADAPSKRPLQALIRCLLPVGMSTGLMVPLVVGSVLPGTIAIAQTAPASPAPTQAILHVNPISGNDNTADGSDRAPFKTITRALDVATPNTIIQLAPGTYSPNTGEVFPLTLKPRVTLRGNPETRGQEVVIRGGGVFASPSLGSQNITILAGANQSSLIGVTVTNPNPNGYGIQIESSSPAIANSSLLNNGRAGIVLVGNSTSIIRSNFFYQNGTSGIRIQGQARPTVAENIFEQNETGIWVDEAAAPVVIGNRITQNKTGITLQGQSQPTLRGNSVEGNEQFGLLAIAPARPNLSSPADGETNFFRNNGKQDIALQNGISPSATPSSSPEPVAKPHLPTAIKATPGGTQPAPPAAKEAVAPPPRLNPNPGSVVVPVVTIPVEQSVRPATPMERRAAPPASVPSVPAIAPTPPLAAPPSSQKPAPQRLPQAGAVNSTGITSSAFPVPAALSNAVPQGTVPRPIQIIQVQPDSAQSPPLNVAPPPATEAPLSTVTIAPTPQAAPTRQPARTSSTPSATAVARPTVTPPQRILTPLPVTPAIADEIPAPPQFAPRPAVVSQPLPAPRLPVLQTPAPTPAFPVPAAIRPTPMPQAIPIPVPQAVPIPVPQAAPAQMTRSRPMPTPVPLNLTPSSAIEIPVPRPDSDRALPTRPPKPPFSPVAMPPLANSSAAGKPSNLLPVPSDKIPVGNVGDMPSVYTVRGGNTPTIPGFPMNPPNTAAVVVKYRVVVVATNETQQEQVRAIIPNAFPVVYRGQRVLQAGAFGDRAKADQLVASLSTQGLQAIIEPLE